MNQGRPTEAVGHLRKALNEDAALVPVIEGQMIRDAIIESPPTLTSADEGTSVHAVWTHLAGVTHPPLFFVVLRIWQDLFALQRSGKRPGARRL